MDPRRTFISILRFHKHFTMSLQSENTVAIYMLVVYGLFVYQYLHGIFVQYLKG